MNNENTRKHIVQSSEWAEFKTKMGTPSVYGGGILFTIHKIPFSNFYIGYAPKVDISKVNINDLAAEAKKRNCVFVKLESNVDTFGGTGINYGKYLVPGKPIFASQTAILEIDKSEEELLAKMHPKTRYNIALAERKGVKVRPAEDEESLNEFVKLQAGTAKRQGFFLHPDNYYKEAFRTLSKHKMAYLLLAELAEPNNKKEKVIAAWMLFRYRDTLYYPYGGSDYSYRNCMASSLLMWEAIKLGKRMGCRVFDMWGAKDDPKDPWYGFTKFKLGFGAKVVTFSPTLDLVLNPFLYRLFILGDKIRWQILNLLRTIK